MLFDLRNDLDLNSVCPWGFLPEKDEAMARLESLCEEKGIQWATNNQRKAMLR